MALIKSAAGIMAGNNGVMKMAIIQWLAIIRHLAGYVGWLISANIRRNVNLNEIWLMAMAWRMKISANG